MFYFSEFPDVFLLSFIISMDTTLYLKFLFLLLEQGKLCHKDHILMYANATSYLENASFKYFPQDYFAIFVKLIIEKNGSTYTLCAEEDFTSVTLDTQCPALHLSNMRHATKKTEGKLTGEQGFLKAKLVCTSLNLVSASPEGNYMSGPDPLFTVPEGIVNPSTDSYTAALGFVDSCPTSVSTALKG